MSVMSFSLSPLCMMTSYIIIDVRCIGNVVCVIVIGKYRRHAGVVDRARDTGYDGLCILVLTCMQIEEIIDTQQLPL